MGLSKYVPSKKFKDFTRADVIRYLDYFRKDESEDPAHKWIGTYNTSLVNFVRFFKWLYSHNIEPTKRPKPKVVQNLHKLRRREMSGYKPSGMWDAEDNFLFLKYCPSPRDRCYHAMEVDTSARPHELLKLRIKDVEFIDGEGGDGGRYAKIVVNGKTGERALPLIDSTLLNGSLITHKEAIERPYYCLICRLVTIIKRFRDLTSNIHLN